MKKIGVSLLFILPILLVSIVQAAPAPITGLVYVDADNDGVHDTREWGAEGVEVALFNNHGTQVAVTVTDTNGRYSLDADNSEAYRLEFSNFPPDHTLGRRGEGLGETSVMFRKGGEEANLALVTASAGCGENFDLATSCYVFGDQQSDMDVLVTFPYMAGGMSMPDYDLPKPAHAASARQIGTTWGLAVNPNTRAIYAGAFMKRHAGFGPDGTGAVYRVAADGSVDTFLDLNVLISTNTAGIDPHPTSQYSCNNGQPLPSGHDCWFHDPDSFDAVGKLSLGDLEISPDGRTLYITNLTDKRLYIVDVSNAPAKPTAADVSSVAFHNATSSCPPEDHRPFALDIADDGTLYAATTCTAQSSQNAGLLRGHIWKLVNNSFQEVVNFPFQRTGCITWDDPCETPSDWLPWTDSMPTRLSRDAVTDAFIFTYPQPWITDFEIEVDHSIIVAVSDRSGDQGGTQAGFTDIRTKPFYDNHSAGDILRLCYTGSSYQLENNGRCGGITTDGSGNNQGIGGGEYYHSDNWDFIHNEVATGSLWQFPDRSQVIATVRNPIERRQAPDASYDGGIRWFDNTTGATTHAYRIFNGDATNQTVLGKANGLGDLERICAAPRLTIEVGNRVWFDEDSDGVQGSEEEPIAGVMVNLYREDTSGSFIKVESTETNALGQYIFAGLLPQQSYVVTLNESTNYTSNFDLETANYVYGPLTKHDEGQGDNGDANDSDGEQMPDPTTPWGDYPMIAFTTGELGDNDHTLDFGFKPLKPTSVGLGETAVIGTLANPLGKVALWGAASLLLVLTVGGIFRKRNQAVTISRPLVSIASFPLEANFNE